jgi:putative salt-induced outer membrane protein YdiY
MLCACALSARADLLVLKNGDRVTGSIVKKDAKSITIKSDTFGVITAPWEQVESITADKPLTVILKDGKSVQGTLSTTGGKVEVATKDARISVAPMEVETLRNAAEEQAYQRMLKPGLGQLWVATGSLGFAGTAGNAKTQTFTTGFAASRTTRHDKTTLTFSSIAASALVNGTNSDTAEAVRGGIGYDHNVSPRVFASVFNADEFDKFQNLDLRFVLGGGFGVHLVKNDRSHLDFSGGGDYNHESFSNGVHRGTAEFYWGDDYSYQLSKAVSLIQTYRMFNNLSNTGEYRVNFDLGLSTKLTKWLNWSAAASDRYLSNPSPGRKRNDFLYTTGIGVTLGH